MPNEIYVKIVDETSADNNSGFGESLTPQAQMRNQNPPSAETATCIQKTKAIAIASMAANRSLSYISSNVGKWTGSSRMQSKVNNIQQLAGLGAMAVTSWPIALASTAITIGTTALDEAYERKWDKKQSDLAKARAGELKGRGH